MSAINILELMKHQDQIADSFCTLLFGCPFCGKRLTAEETKGYGGKPSISCDCGASMGYGFGVLELLMHWNRRDGIEFSMDAEYAQRLIAAQSELAEFKRSAMEEFKRQRKDIAEATARAVRAEAELARIGGDA